jgi:hypothetical protein
MRCPEAMKIRDNKKYLKSVTPPLRNLMNAFPKEFFTARRSLPDEMGSGLKTVRVATLREI